MSRAVLLLNLGTPAAPTARGLREFYKYFFADPFVFDFNPVGRWLLRNLIVRPFRAPRVAADYAAIWTDQGSPLQVYAERLQASVQAAFEQDDSAVTVRTGMACSKPFVSEVMAELERVGAREILLLPMFPQYSTATTASAFHQVRKAAARWRQAPVLRFVDDLFREPAFIRCWKVLIERHREQEDWDHLVFSYHGVPEKTIRKADRAGVCQFGHCCRQITEDNRRCYRMQCVQTTRGIVEALGWSEDGWSIAFQSRFGPLPWIQPYLNERLKELVGQGAKRVAIVTPSFISDCLETLHEIGIGYRQEFMDAGGEQFTLLPNLNDDQDWQEAVYGIARAHLGRATDTSGIDSPA